MPSLKIIPKRNTPEYTKFRKASVAAVKNSDKNLSNVAADLGLPQPTLRKWCIEDLNMTAMVKIKGRTSPHRKSAVKAVRSSSLSLSSVSRELGVPQPTLRRWCEEDLAPSSFLKVMKRGKGVGRPRAGYGQTDLFDQPPVAPAKKASSHAVVIHLRKDGSVMKVDTELADVTVKVFKAC